MQIAEESFMEIINIVLTTGMVSTLFSDEEKDEIINVCREKAQKQGLSVTK